MPAGETAPTPVITTRRGKIAFLFSIIMSYIKVALLLKMPKVSLVNWDNNT
jgi:hypothetical protein